MKIAKRVDLKQSYHTHISDAVYKCVKSLVHFKLTQCCQLHLNKSEKNKNLFNLKVFFCIIAIANIDHRLNMYQA